MGIQINGQTDTITATDGSLTVSGADIGSASASSLNISGIVTATGGVVVAAGTTAAPSISPTGDSNTGIFFPSADTIAFGEGGAEALRIDSSGNIGVGTNGPVATLDVITNSTTEGLRVRGRLSDNIGSIYFYNNSASTSQGYIQSRTTDLRIDTDSSKPLIFYTGGSERVRVSAAGAVQIANGNLIFSTAGTGIDFSATANGSGTMTSELLSDYEEGTWTPSYSSAFTGTYTANGQIGRYVKVGKLVTAYFFIQVSTVSGSGNIALTGLPYATPSATNYNPGAVIHLTANWITNHPFSVDADGAGTAQYNIKYRSSSNGNTDSNIAVSNLATNAYMRATIVYEAA